MAESEKRNSLIEGTADEHAGARAEGYKRARQLRVDRHWLFMAAVLLGAVGYAVYALIAQLL
jgi:hypothetical protein